ncbi:hypothetical protein LTS09_002779 [Friedmanniomyces endolithicus]|nr:hypothetical protein LTS09_002779 [Friedmanniomyces endolithicus]
MIPRSMQEAAQWHQQNNGQSYSQRMHGQQQGRQPQAHQQPYGYSGGNQAFHGFVEDGSIHSGSGGSGGGRSNRGGGRNDGGGNQAFQGFVEDGSIHSGSGGSGGGRSNRGEEGRTSEAPARRRPDEIGVEYKEHYYAGPQDSGPYMMSGGLGPASGGGNRAFQSSGGNRAFQGRSEDRRTHDNGGEFGGGRPNDGNGGGGGRNSKSLKPPTR